MTTVCRTQRWMCSRTAAGSRVHQVAILLVIVACVCAPATLWPAAAQSKPKYDWTSCPEADPNKPTVVSDDQAKWCKRQAERRYRAYCNRGVAGNVSIEWCRYWAER